MANGLIAPHGGELVINLASEDERAELQEVARSLPQIVVGSRQLADLTARRSQQGEYGRAASARADEVMYANDGARR